jgi:hypothetical protein
MKYPPFYRTAQVDGLSIFYRERDAANLEFKFLRPRRTSVSFPASSMLAPARRTASSPKRFRPINLLTLLAARAGSQHFSVSF